MGKIKNIEELLKERKIVKETISFLRNPQSKGILLSSSDELNVRQKYLNRKEINYLLQGLENDLSEIEKEINSLLK